jgi:galactose mutarotase-like enzyme
LAGFFVFRFYFADMRTTTIENEFLSVSFNHVGAELSSLIDKQDKVEHMWKADPEFWPRQAPLLFPCVGESRDGKISVDGESYPMGRHGFARHERFTVVGESKSHVVLELRSDPNTLRQYPFDFVFRARYELKGAQLITSFEVINSGIREMGFQLGGHPAFAVPFGQNGNFNDYKVEFGESMTIDRHLLTDKGLYSGKEKPFLNNEAEFELFYDLFKEDALVFKHIPAKQVWIQHRDGGKRLQMDYEGFAHFGIWSVPGADYVCLEPWIGCADMHDQPKDFFKKDSLIVLKPEERFEASFVTSIKP